MTTATRASFRRVWHDLVHRNRYVRITNLTEGALRCEYLGETGVTIPAGETVDVRLRRPTSFRRAAKYHDMMQADVTDNKIEIVDVE